MQARLDDASDTNATILGAACAGDASAWDELVRRYRGVVRAAVGSYRLKPADAADAIRVGMPGVGVTETSGRPRSLTLRSRP